ncbi:MAG: hypothetical protein LBB85_07025, partial [Dysgonamonadaceae bacterium]|nr:hypothetical protein [Dysgonamonadaceae bacterium]
TLTGTPANSTTTASGYTFDISVISNKLIATVTAAPAPAPTYGVSIATFEGGSVTADKTSAVAGETVTLAVSTNTGYELASISVRQTASPYATVALSGSGNTRTFTMPAYGVTVTATFQKNADQTAVETAQSLIEALSCTLPQATGNTQSTVRNWLVNRINALPGMSATGITITASTAIVAFSSFYAATAGTADNPSGVNGSFRFTVSLTKGNSYLTASNSGTIIATAYIAPTTYAVTIEGSANGTVTANPTVATAGTTVSLTLTPANGYELETITVFRTGSESTTVALSGAGADRTFIMPAYNVTVRATFQKTQAQLDNEAVDAAKAAIEEGTYHIAQATGNTETTVKTWLIYTLNVLFGQSHNMQLRSASAEPIDAEVGITSLTPAIAGTETTPAGVDGSFLFTVTLKRGQAAVVTVETPGVIIATPYAPTPVKQIELLLLDETTIGILNTGNVATGDLTLTLTGDRSDAFILSPATPGSLSAGSETNIVLTPDASLAPGVYTLTLTVSADGLTPVSINIAYTVRPVGTENVESSTLRVIAAGAGFRITGLIPGETLSLYNMQGQLIHQSKANATEQHIPLHVRGVYIVISGIRAVKAAY